MPFQPGNQLGKATAGIPKKPRIVTQHLIALLNEVDLNDVPKVRRFAEALLAKALEGDVAAMKEVADRVDGKVPVQVQGDPDNPLTIERIIHEIVRADPNQRINPPDAGYSKAS
jgi:hypothetical protein